MQWQGTWLSRIIKLLLIVLLLAVVLIALVLYNSSSLAERTIRAELAKQDIQVESLTVTSFDTKAIALDDVALGEGGVVRAKHALIGFVENWQNLLAGAFDAQLTDVEIRATLQDGQILLGGIEKRWSEALVTPNASAIAIHFTGDLHVVRQVSGDMRIDITSGNLTLMQNQKNLVLPLGLDGQGKLENGQLTAQGKFADVRNKVRGTFRGDYAIASKRGTITWETQPMQFSETGLTFATLAPGYAADIAPINGQLALKGKVDLQPKSWTVTPTIMVLELPVERLLKDVLGEGTQVTGSVKGAVPIKISKGGTWRIEKSRLINIGPMAIRVNPQTLGAALATHPEGELVKSALSNLQVEKLTLDIVSTDDKGGAKLDWHFVGRNPELMGGQTVDFTLAVTANLRDIWRSLQEVKKITNEAERLLRKR